eukprot:2375357-Rhodomonas_salina.2
MRRACSCAGARSRRLGRPLKWRGRGDGSCKTRCSCKCRSVPFAYPGSLSVLTLAYGEEPY